MSDVENANNNNNLTSSEAGLDDLKPLIVSLPKRKSIISRLTAGSQESKKEENDHSCSPDDKSDIIFQV